MRALTQRSLARLRTPTLLPSALRLVWLLGVLWCELGSYRFAVWICGWPDTHLKGASADTTHVLVITDPQVRHSAAHKHSCFLPGLHDWFYHAGLRRSWRYANNLRPDVVVFLGDMLASGRKIKDDDEYVTNYNKFRDIFSIDSNVSVFHVPGNEDVGLNLHSEDAIHAQRRYSTHFGPLNSEVSISNHTFVFINAPGLVEEDYQRARHRQEFDTYNAPAGGTVDFLRLIQRRNNGAPKEPTILFSHIPLFRPDNAGCGPMRERGTIRRGAGPGYQNMLGKHTSEFLLDAVKPARVFSGDDRDFCEYTHSRPSTTSSPPVLVREVTVKSFSPDKRITQPGFHLLSLVPPSADSVEPGPGGALPSLADAACALPAQERMYTAFYAPLAALTLLLFLGRRVRELRARPHASPLPSFSPHPDAGLRGPQRGGAYAPLVRWWRATAGTLFGGQRKRVKREPGNGYAPLTKSSSAVLDSRRAVRRVAMLVLLDFVRALWPALILWATAMWYTC